MSGSAKKKPKSLIKEIADLNDMKFEAKPPNTAKESKYARKRRESRR